MVTDTSVKVCRRGEKIAPRLLKRKERFLIDSLSTRENTVRPTLSHTIKCFLYKARVALWAEWQSARLFYIILPPNSAYFEFVYIYGVFLPMKRTAFPHRTMSSLGWWIHALYLPRLTECTPQEGTQM